ncbi:MAG: DMT family transporter [Candidatus Eisenbacteria bacterium]
MALLALVLVNLVFGATFVVVKDAMTHVAPVRFLALRFLVAGPLLLVAAALFQRSALAHAATWRDGALLGALLFVSYALQTTGLVFTTPAVSAFLTALSVPMIPLLGLWFLGERVNAITWFGVATAAAGLVALTLPGHVAPGPGEALTVLTAIGFAVHIVLTARMARRTPPLPLVAVQLVVAGVLALLALPLDGWLAARGATGAPAAALLAPLPPIAWLEVVGMGLGATALTFFLQTWAQRRLSATRAGVTFALEPVFATVFSLAFFAERIGLRAAAGMLLILAGMLVVEVLGHREPALAGPGPG